MVLIEVFVNA